MRLSNRDTAAVIAGVITAAAGFIFGLKGLLVLVALLAADQIYFRIKKGYWQK